MTTSREFDLERGVAQPSPMLESLVTLPPPPLMKPYAEACISVSTALTRVKIRKEIACLEECSLNVSNMCRPLLLGVSEGRHPSKTQPYPYYLCQPNIIRSMDTNKYIVSNAVRQNQHLRTKVCSRSLCIRENCSNA